MQGKVKYACSEEVPEPVDLQGSGFSVAFDPLDGSSIVDTNFTVGTIFGVWPGDKLTGITGRDQVWKLTGLTGRWNILSNCQLRLDIAQLWTCTS